VERGPLLPNKAAVALHHEHATTGIDEEDAAIHRDMDRRARMGGRTYHHDGEAATQRQQPRT
jgi:hypothetical protein